MLKRFYGLLAWLSGTILIFILDLIYRIINYYPDITQKGLPEDLLGFLQSIINMISFYYMGLCIKGGSLKITTKIIIIVSQLIIGYIIILIFLFEFGTMTGMVTI